MKLNSIISQICSSYAGGECQQAHIVLVDKNIIIKNAFIKRKVKQYHKYTYKIKNNNASVELFLFIFCLCSQTRVKELLVLLGNDLLANGQQPSSVYILCPKIPVATVAGF